MRILEVTGYVVADAERKISKNGKEYMTFRIGSNEFNDKDENGKQRTYWISVTTTNQRLFGMSQYLTKGKSVIVIGDYSDRIYQNRQGNCDISREIFANGIYFNSTNKEDNNNREQSRNPMTQTSMQSSANPMTQTSMQPSIKPSTADLKVPQQVQTTTENKEDEEDDLPF